MMTKTLGRLTWRDGVATLIVLFTFGLYAAYLAGAGLPVVGGVRGLAVAALILGVSACAVGATESAKATPAKQIGQVLGAVAGIAFLIALFTGNGIALAFFLGAIGLLWAATTVQHLIGSLSRTTPGKTMHPVG
ncbi:hypothetical protein Snas_3455 [Stackebrandtia nassauensis DSM 44728]|uniref:Uncharacterized protein n=2 Tax=Stackebrandtia TaxID=283810 RepID=D3PVK5_STANL|nr:hypothetical protein Snas_3455 [Stackebrandtia nassauensis DSM 44728]